MVNEDGDKVFDEIIEKLSSGKDLEKVKEELRVTEIGKSLIEEGIELGKREKAIDAAKKAILKGIDTETISDITDLSIHDIELIRIVIQLQ